MAHDAPRSESRDRNAARALLLWRMALEVGDSARIDLARATLNACGYPGGESAPTIDEAMAQIAQQDAAAGRASGRSQSGDHSIDSC